MSDRHVTKLVIWLLIMSLCVWFWLIFVPKEYLEARDTHRERVKPTVEDYIENGWDPYEYEGDWGTHAYPDDDPRWERPPYIEDDEAGLMMPGPMLECDAGDHTCID